MRRGAAPCGARRTRRAARRQKWPPAAPCHPVRHHGAHTRQCRGGRAYLRYMLASGGARLRQAGARAAQHTAARQNVENKGWRD